jgi:hypothetical protein
MRTVKKAGGALVAFGIAAATLHWILGEVAVRFEMWSTGTTSRADLANDFGLGLLWLVIVVPGSFVGAVVASWWVWHKLSVREPTNERVA